MQEKKCGHFGLIQEAQFVRTSEISVQVTTFIISWYVVCTILH
jgi:hypothetical protein